MCRARISFPVPVSPVTRTVAWLGATCRMRCRSSLERGSSNTKALARIESTAASEDGSVNTGIGRGLYFTSQNFYYTIDHASSAPGRERGRGSLGGPLRGTDWAPADLSNH